jgi:Kef-type K+ transport system membrane component KefB
VRTAATALTTTTHAGDLVDLAGYVADTGPAQQLSEIGIILLTFGVGIHFSVGDLLSVRRITVPGAAVQIALATALGAVVVGWPWLGNASSALAGTRCLTLTSPRMNAGLPQRREKRVGNRLASSCSDGFPERRHQLAGHLRRDPRFR